MSLRDELLGFFMAGVEAASAPAVLAGLLPTGTPQGRTLVLGCGKAAAAMAEVAAKILPGDIEGCVVTRIGHGPRAPTGGIEVIEASHPVPDAASREAGRRIRELAASARAGDRVIFLVSGGGSALLCDPLPGLSLEEKAGITGHLIHSGAPIAEINLVRRHLSGVKGGRLAAAAGAAVSDMHSFLLSDVAGDDPAAIASGPTIPASFEPEAALAILRRTGWPVDPRLENLIRSGECGPVPVHPVHLVANGLTALDAVTAAATKTGWNVVMVDPELEGDAAETGRAHAVLAMDYAARPGRHLLLSGGELTVRVRAEDGAGGPNLEYLAGLMAALPPAAPVAALAGDSDGIDGSADNAGGYFDAATRAASDQCEAALAENSTYALFRQTGGLIFTGPTRTNVNDIRMVAVGELP